MTRVQVSLRIPGTAPIPELIKLIQGVEAAGFDGAGILDSQLLCRDTFVTLGLASAHTSTLTLFPAVTNPRTRHVSVLGSAIQTVEEIAPGRIKVVVGTGYTSAHTIGRKPATLDEMRACIATLRALLAGETVMFDRTSGRVGAAHSGLDGGVRAESDRARRRDRRRRPVVGRLSPADRRRGAEPSRGGRGARRATARGSRNHLGGSRRDRAQHRGGAPTGAADRGASGLAQRTVALASVHRPHAAAVRHSAGGSGHLPRSGPRARLGAGDRRDVVRSG